MQKLKTTLLAGIFVLGLAFTTLGSLSRHGAGQVAAQTVFPPQAAGNRTKDDDGSLQEQEKKLLLQLKDIREQRALLNMRRASAILGEIEASLKKLRQATAGNAESSRAVDAFEQAFVRLKKDLHNSKRTPKFNPDGGAKGTGPSSADSGGSVLRPSGIFNLIFSDGRVLQVDSETKTALLSVGSKDGVKKGNVYRAYRGSEESPSQTAWLRVTEVSAKWSIATITQNYAPRAPLQPQDIIQRDEEKNNAFAPHAVEAEFTSARILFERDSNGKALEPRVEFTLGAVEALKLASFFPGIRGPRVGVHVPFNWKSSLTIIFQQKGGGIRAVHVKADYSKWWWRDAGTGGERRVQDGLAEWLTRSRITPAKAE